MTAGRLLRYRVTALGRRLAGPRTASGALVWLLALGAAAATTWAVSRWAIGDLADEAGFARSLGDRVFWLSALPVLIFAYTTFEVIFRAPDGAFVAVLPLDGRLRWVDLQVRAYVVHAPLLVPALAYAGTLLWHGHDLAALRVASVAGAATMLGVALCSRIHLMAGRSMLRESTALSRSLSGALVDDEAALILYAPAGGLGLTLVLVVFLDVLAARACATGGDPTTLLLTLAGLLGATVWIVARAASEASGCLPLIISRFREIDTPLPYRDDGLPEQTPGEGLAGTWPAQVQALFLRDLRQLRRRYRLDRILLWLFAALALRAGVEARGGAAVTYELLWLYVAFVGLFWTNAFRVHGPELASPWLGRTLPLRARPMHHASLAIDLLYPMWALLWAVAAALVAAQWSQAALVAALGSGIAVTGAALSRTLARMATQHSTAASVAWRAAIVLALAVAPMGGP